MSTCTGMGRAREFLGDPAPPDLYVSVLTNARGLRSLPDFGERLKRVGCDRDSRKLEVREILGLLSPRLAEALERHLDYGRRCNRSPAWRRAQIGTADRFTAERIRIGYDALTMSWLQLFEEEIETTPPSPDPLLEDELGLEYAKLSRVSPLRAVVDEAALISAEKSPLQRYLPNGVEVPEGEVPFYSRSVTEDLLYLFGLVESVYGRAMQHADTARWADVVERPRRWSTT